ncbi:MAG TPA: hypothetical protein VK609_04710 [Mucilaginibacter sp.]|nr:hypothetical protein [Mucilaginibacter sp.]
MTKFKLKPVSDKLRLILFIFIAFIAIIINSCKKDVHSEQQTVITDPVVAQAKSWYESAFPLNNKTGALSVNSHATGSNMDYSQLFKPDWQHAATYTRINQPVVELPVDASSVKLDITLGNSAGGKPVFNKSYTRSSFLLLNNGTEYKAYIMTVIADSSYLKNDLTKLDHNKYKNGMLILAGPSYTLPLKDNLLAAGFTKTAA